MHKSNKNFQLNTKKMKKMLIFALILCATATISLAQEVVPTNRYAMKLKASADGSYTLLNEHRYAKLVDLSKLPDLLIPYTHQNNRLSSKDYKGIEVKEVIYRTHKGYELQLAIDMAVSENPTPVMFFVHGGGWARGSNASSRSLSQYLAKQKGITGVRIQYSLAPQPGATVEVTRQRFLSVYRASTTSKQPLSACERSRRSASTISASAIRRCCTALRPSISFRSVVSVP